MNRNLPPEFALLLGMTVFGLFWLGLTFLISKISGWQLLASRFRCVEPVIGKIWMFQSAEMRRYMRTSFNNCLIITANEDGMRLSMLVFFRFGHPPLYIPWSETMVTQTRRWLFLRRVRFTFPSEPEVWLEISERLANRIQRTIGQEWFADVEPSNESPDPIPDTFN
jgi:hypothetical protein